MKYNILFACLLFFTACNNAPESKDYSKIPTGTVIVGDSIRVTEDDLNETYFSVKIITIAKTSDGKYGVHAAWGYNTAESEFTLPKGGEKFVPALRKQPEPYTYIVGFNMPDDTSFYPYYQVKGEQGGIQMQYIKSYTFE